MDSQVAGLRWTLAKLSPAVPREAWEGPAESREPCQGKPSVRGFMVMRVSALAPNEDRLTGPRGTEPVSWDPETVARP